MTKLPRGMSLLIFTQMWERFSFYGMRTLLTLFLMEKSGLTAINAIGIYALFSSLINFAALGGGYLGDRIFGLQHAVFIGGLMITLGHLCLIFEQGLTMVFVSLSLIIIGSALFSPNLKALAGDLYDPHDPRKNAGFSLFYAGINLGGFLAAVFCGIFARAFGWHVGFGVAGFGMLAGLSLFLKFVDPNKKATTASSRSRYFSLIILMCLVLTSAAALKHHAALSLHLPLLALILLTGWVLQKRKESFYPLLRMLLGHLIFFMAFFVIEDLMGSYFMILCEQSVDRHFIGFTIPSSSLIAINPLVIIFLGSFMAFFQNPKKLTSGDIYKKASAAFLFLALALASLWMGSKMVNPLGLIPLFYVVFSFVLIAIGELFMAPPLYAFCTSSSPSILKGQCMSLVIFSRALASFLSGLVGKEILSSSGREESVFALGAILALGFSFFLVLLFQGVKKRSIKSPPAYEVSS